jgi:hypothetical protein
MAMATVANLLGPAFQLRWRNSPVRSFECCLPEVFDYLPEFERRTLALQDADGMRSCLNPKLDTMIMKPHGDDPNYVPVGVVSKGYTLVPHKEVLRAATDGLRNRLPVWATLVMSILTGIVGVLLALAIKSGA